MEERRYEMAEYIKGEDGRVYANEETKIGWETIQAAKEVVRSLPPENIYDEFSQVSFKGSRRLNQTRGFLTILVAGTVVYTGS